MDRLPYAENAEGLSGVDWDDFRVFLEIVQTGSINRAAAKLGLTQPTVSRRLLRLEGSLGIKLFDRDRRGPRLTADGQRIYNDACAARTALGRAVNRTPGSRNMVEGGCKLLVSDGLATYWVSRFLAPYFARHPNIALRMFGASTAAADQRQTFDLSISYRQSAEPGAASIRLGTVHLVPFASREYLRVHGTPQNTDALSRHRLLDLAVYLSEMGIWTTWSQQHGGTDAAFLTNLASCLGEAVRHGAGIAVLPTYAVAVYDNLIPLDIGVHYTLPVYLCYARDRLENWAIKATLAFLRECTFDKKQMPWFRDAYVPPQVDWQRRLDHAIDRAAIRPASEKTPAIAAA